MTEFITRCCHTEKRYEVIIKTDSHEHYKATEDFARRLIDHAKPQTNADRIRAMSDEELAKFIPDWSYTNACKCDEQPYVYCNNECEKCGLEWLKQPVGVDHE